MGTALEYSKTGLRLAYTTSTRPAPRPQQTYPIPPIPVAVATLLDLALENVAETGRKGIRITSRGSSLPGEASTSWTLLHACYQGTAPANLAWEEIPVTGAKLNLLLDLPLPSATHRFRLRSILAGQTTLFPEAAIATPADTTLGDLAALMAIAANAAADGKIIDSEKVSLRRWLEDHRQRWIAAYDAAVSAGMSTTAGVLWSYREELWKPAYAYFAAILYTTTGTYDAYGSVGLGAARTGTATIYPTTVAYNAAVAGGDTLAISGVAWGLMLNGINNAPLMVRSSISALPATASTLGQVKVGTGLSIDANGLLVVTGGGGSSTWGGISGLLSNQTDLQNALNAKAPTASPTFTVAATINDATESQLVLKKAGAYAAGLYNSGTNLGLWDWANSRAIMQHNLASNVTTFAAPTVAMNALTATNGDFSGYAKSMLYTTRAGFLANNTGSYWAGFGTSGTNLIRLGACDASGNWNGTTMNVEVLGALTATGAGLTGDLGITATTANVVLKGGGATTGFVLRSSASKEGYIWNYEAQPLYFGTNGNLAITIATNLQATFAAPAQVFATPLGSGSLLTLRDTSATGTGTYMGGLFLNSSPGHDFLVAKRSVNGDARFVIQCQSGPWDLLEINGGTKEAVFSGPLKIKGAMWDFNANGVFYFGNSSGWLTWDTTYAALVSASGKDLRLETSSSGKGIRINQSGNVLASAEIYADTSYPVTRAKYSTDATYLSAANNFTGDPYQVNNHPGLLISEMQTSSANSPSGGGYAGTLLHFADAGGQDVRTLFAVDSSGTDFKFNQSWGNGVWRGWKTVYHSGNIDQTASALMAVQAYALAPQWVASLPALPDPKYPKAIWNATTSRYDGGLVCIISTKAMYQNQNNSWVSVGVDFGIFGQLTAAQISANSIGAGALVSDLVMSTTIRTSNGVWGGPMNAHLQGGVLLNGSGLYMGPNGAKVSRSDGQASLPLDYATLNLGKALVYMGNERRRVYVGESVAAPNTDLVSVRCLDSRTNSSSQQVDFQLKIQPSSLSTDNLHGLLRAEVEYWYIAEGSPRKTEYITLHDPVEYDAAWSGSNNAILVSWHTMFNQMVETNNISMHWIKLRLVNKHGFGPWRWFQPANNSNWRTAQTTDWYGNTNGSGGGGYRPPETRD